MMQGMPDVKRRMPNADSALGWTIEVMNFQSYLVTK